MKVFRRFLTSVIFICSAVSLFAQNNKLHIPDSSVIRKAIAGNWFEQPLSILRNNPTELRLNSIGQTFQVRMEESRDLFSVIVAPETSLSVDFYTEKGVEKKIVEEYPADAAGSWILMRDSSSGNPIRIRYYFAADSDVYIQFSPNGNKSLADYVIDGCFAARGVPVGVPFSYFYTASFAQVMSLTEKSLPWAYAEIHPQQYHSNLTMIGVIQKNLSRIKNTRDACYNELGEAAYVSTGEKREENEEDVKNNILTMNHSGFLKWIVDGLIEPLAGSKTFIKPLHRPTTSPNPLGVSGIKSQSENLFHSLDWTRNLAAAKVSIQSRRNYLYEEAGVDVDIEPFSSEVTDKGITAVAGYIKNTGYEIKYLKPLLYVLAVKDPSYFYLGAIRRSVIPSDGSPEFQTFDSSAAIFPYFDKDGQFGCVIFEAGQKMTLAQFTKKYPDSFIHLTRVLSSEMFNPI